MVDIPNDASPAVASTRNARRWWSGCYFFFVTVPILIYDGLALFFYTLVLFPAFLRMAFYYFWVSDRTVVRYNRKSMRQTMDIYWPTTTTLSHNDLGLFRNGNDPPAVVDGNCLKRRLLGGGGGGAEETIPHSTDQKERLRQRLQSDPRPILVFVCGGAWMIGYKMWGALLARVLTHTGLTVLLPDYRNHPFWGTIPDQVDDIEAALQWLLGQIEPRSTETTTTMHRMETAEHHQHHHHEPLDDDGRLTRRKIILVGQSAGGHLVMTLLLRNVLQQTRATASTAGTPLTGGGNDTARSFVATDLSGMIVLSAPLDLQNVYTSTFRKHGLQESFMQGMFRPALMSDYNPLQLLEEIPPPDLRNRLPPMQVYHGNRDRTVPYQGSMRFVERFQQLGVAASDSSLHEDQEDRISFHMYDGWSHTDPILEGPMDADHRFHSDIFTAVLHWTSQEEVGDSGSPRPDTLQWPNEETSPVMKRLCPHLLVRMGRFCMPF